MSDFEREERYIVIKRKYLDEASESALLGVIHGLDLPTEECVVVEHDWPNYDATWRSVQQVAEGTYDPDQLTRLQSEVERLRGRCGEVEAGLEGIANCAYGYNHPKAQTADEAASWMNGEAMRLLGNPQPSAWLLRKQAEAIEATTKAHEIKSATDDSKCYSLALLDHAQRLRQQADEAEKTGG